MTVTLTSPMAPADVHRSLARHILADGYDLVAEPAVPVGAAATPAAPPSR